EGVTMGKQGSVEWPARLLRAWHLAILRLAVSRDPADRQGVFEIANQIDRLGQHEGVSGFSFFHETSAKLCAAMLRNGDGDDVVLRRYLAQIDDVRLHRALAVALEAPAPVPNSARKRATPSSELWLGLPSRSSSRR